MSHIYPKASSKSSRWLGTERSHTPLSSPVPTPPPRGHGGPAPLGQEGAPVDSLPRCGHRLECGRAELCHRGAQSLQTLPRILETRVRTFVRNACHLSHTWAELPGSSLGKETRVEATLHDRLSPELTLTAVRRSLLCQPQNKPPLFASCAGGGGAEAPGQMQSTASNSNRLTAPHLCIPWGSCNASRGGTHGEGQNSAQEEARRPICSSVYEAGVSQGGERERGRSYGQRQHRRKSWG